MKATVRVVEARVEDLEVGDVFSFRLPPNGARWSEWRRADAIKPNADPRGRTLLTTGTTVHLQSPLAIVRVQQRRALIDTPTTTEEPSD